MQNRVYWITGLSGSGKTTIGRALYARLREHDSGVVFLDGDEMRTAIGTDLGYTLQERKACAMRYAGLCHLLGAQGLTVVCCTISMFDEVRAWNREHIPGYTEVYVKVSTQALTVRDQKGLYSRHANGKQNNLVGIDLKAELPKNPDFILDNENGIAVADAVEKIVSRHYTI